jgi:hypothetical protein
LPARHPEWYYYTADIYTLLFCNELLNRVGLIFAHYFIEQGWSRYPDQRAHPRSQFRVELRLVLRLVRRHAPARYPGLVAAVLAEDGAENLAELAEAAE